MCGLLSSGFNELRKNRYVGFRDAARRWKANAEVAYDIFGLEGALRFKTSDTVFILGSGPSLGRIQGPIAEEVSRCDSISLNFSMMYPHTKPAYLLLSYEREGIARDVLCRELAAHRARLADSVFLLSRKMLWRLGHPRVLPEFFPENPLCWLYDIPPAISFSTARDFRDEDFDKTLVYRGSMTVALHVAVTLGYKNIVLVGVDPNTSEHFFDSYPSMTDYVEFQKSRPHIKRVMTENMYPKTGKIHAIDVYLYALREYLARKKGVQLHVAFEDSVLCPGLPAYFPAV